MGYKCLDVSALCRLHTGDIRLLDRGILENMDISLYPYKNKKPQNSKSCGFLSLYCRN